MVTKTMKSNPLDNGIHTQVLFGSSVGASKSTEQGLDDDVALELDEQSQSFLSRVACTQLCSYSSRNVEEAQKVTYETKCECT